MKKWILFCFMAAAVGGVFSYYYDGSSLDGFRPHLLTVIFTVSTFSVMLSMGGFNASAYRQFHPNIPSRLLIACLLVLAITLVPLAVLVFHPAVFVQACLVVLPVLLLAGAFLLGVGRQETDPAVLLDRLCSSREIERHLLLAAPQIAAKIAETKELALSKSGERPTHEFSWHLALPPIPNDPLTHLATLGLLSMQYGDLISFRDVMERFLDAQEVANSVQLPNDNDKYDIRKELRKMVFNAHQRVTLALQRDKGTIVFARVAIDALAEFIVMKTKTHQQTTDISFSALYLMETLAKHCYESGSANELRVPIIVGRQIVQKGLDDPPLKVAGRERSDDEMNFQHNLPQLSNVIKRVGNYAISQGDAELLYRCFDAFIWLGCSAVRHRNMGVATACLRGLSQLGREVRVKELECFWSRCPLRPEDHAEKGIEDIITWLSQMTDKQRPYWVELAEAALSRFYGKETEIAFECQPDGELGLRISKSKKDYVEKFIMNDGSREANYADFTFLKDLELHGGKGTLMQGPVVPLFPSKKAEKEAELAKENNTGGKENND